MYEGKIIQTLRKTLVKLTLFKRNFYRKMIRTPAEPIVFHLGPVDAVCPQKYLITYAHLLNSYYFDLEPSTLFLYSNHEAEKIYSQFCFEKLGYEIQNKCEFFYFVAFHL